jgi:hypothetical protein
MGYRTMFLAFPSEKTSIIVLCNNGMEDAAKLAIQVAEVFLSSRMDSQTTGVGLPTHRGGNS